MECSTVLSHQKALLELPVIALNIICILSKFHHTSIVKASCPDPSPEKRKEAGRGWARNRLLRKWRKAGRGLGMRLWCKSIRPKPDHPDRMLRPRPCKSMEGSLRRLVYGSWILCCCFFLVVGAVYWYGVHLGGHNPPSAPRSKRSPARPSALRSKQVCSPGKIQLLGESMLHPSILLTWGYFIY